MRFIHLFIAVLVSAVAVAQSSNEELAAFYYSKGEYDKAVVLYKKIHKANPRSIYIYENYLNCLIALEEGKKAESVVKKQIKRESTSIHFKVDLGYVYMQFNKKEKADKYFAKLIEEYSSSQTNLTHQLAQSFLKREFPDLAIRSFEVAVQKQGLKHYWMSLLNLYRATGDYKSATILGLDVIKNDPKKMSTVMYHFGYMLEQEGAAEFIQETTLLYIQKNPGINQYDELLMNIFLLQKIYGSALRQAKAMDKRRHEDGSRVLNVAHLCVKNKAYNVAEKGYEYLIAKGPRSLYYIDGRMGLLNSQYLQITHQHENNDSALEVLTSNYESFLKDFNYSSGTSKSMKRLAELYLLYTAEPKKAITLLDELLKVRRLATQFRGEVKLLLGDAYLVNGEIWEARLLYGQVDKEFKEEELGQEAKFRSARLSYFTGDFEWANEQLEILKTATSQLISNNALELALLIQDNTGFDSTGAAMKEYAEAEFLLFQNRYTDCLKILNMIPFKYANHSLTDEVLFLKGKVKEEQGEFRQALSFYKQVYEGFSFDILADNSLYKAAEIHYNVFGETELAKALYEQIILNHTSSLFAVEARKKFELIEKNAVQ